MHLCNDVWWCWNTVSVWLMMDIDCWIRFICNQNQQMVPVHESVLASNWGRKHPLRVTSCLEKTERNKTKQRIPPQGVWQKSCFFFCNFNVLYSYTTLFQNCSHLVPAFHRLHGPPIGCISRMASGDISATEVAAKKYWDWVGDLFMICFFFESCSFRKLEWWTTFLGNFCSSCDLYLTKFATKWQKMRCFLRHFSWQHFVEQLPRKAMSFLWIQCPMHVKHNGRHGVPKFCLLVWCWAGGGTIG